MLQMLKTLAKEASSKAFFTCLKKSALALSFPFFHFSFFGFGDLNTCNIPTETSPTTSFYYHHHPNSILLNFTGRWLKIDTWTLSCKPETSLKSKPLWNKQTKICGFFIKKIQKSLQNLIHDTVVSIFIIALPTKKFPTSIPNVIHHLQLVERET